MPQNEPGIEEIFPVIERAIELEPEELAVFVLRYLQGLEEAGREINRHNLMNIHWEELAKYAGDYKNELPQRLMEAWRWLEKEIFVAPQPGASGDVFFITRRGRRILEEQDFTSYRKGQLLPSEGLDPVLVRKVKPLFIRGDYDTAVFQAFKEVEIRVRKKGGYDSTMLGMKLMREAFKTEVGPLVDSSLDRGEQEAIMHLFAGAIGTFKNPSSHRDVEYTDPNEVADIIHIANQLLRMCEG
jgi:uncharacterized protein (TIGR02391 family)